MGGGGGIGENNNKRERGLDVKFNTYRGALLFIRLSNINTNFGIKLTNLSTLRCSDL